MYQVCWQVHSHTPAFQRNNSCWHLVLVAKRLRGTHPGHCAKWALFKVTNCPFDGVPCFASPLLLIIELDFFLTFQLQKAWRRIVQWWICSDMLGCKLQKCRALQIYHALCSHAVLNISLGVQQACLWSTCRAYLLYHKTSYATS